MTSSARAEPEPSRQVDSAAGRRNPFDLADHPIVHTLHPYALTLVVAFTIFILALNGGAYGLTGRNSLAIGIWWTLILTVSLSILPLERPGRSALLIGGFIAGLAALTVSSIAWADSAEKAFTEFNRVTMYLGVFALAVLAGSRANVRRWSDGIAIAITSIALLALASRFFPHLIGDGSLNQVIPTLEARLSYPLNYWNGLGILTALAFPFLLSRATETRVLFIRAIAVMPLPALVATIYLTSSRGGAAAALVGTIAFLGLTSRRTFAVLGMLCATAGSATAIAVLVARPQLVDGPLQSSAAVAQGASAALLIGLICFLTGLAYALGSQLIPRSKVFIGKRLKIALAAVGIVLIVVGVAAADPLQRLEGFKQPVDQATLSDGGFTKAHLLSANGRGRWQLWQSAVDQFQSRPLLGRGAGSYEAWWAQHGNVKHFVRDAHSLYLELLGELGVAGLLLLLAAFGTGIVVATKRLWLSESRDRSVIAALIAVLFAFAVGAGIDWMWELTVVGVVGILCLGLMVGPATRLSSQESSDARRRDAPSEHAWRFLPRAVFVVVGLLLIFSQLIPLLTHTEIRASQAAVARGDGEGALSSALVAKKLQPWASSPYLQLALVEEQMGNLSKSQALIGDAIDRDSSDWRLWFVSARIKTKRGSIKGARKSLAQAKRLNPNSSLFASR